MSMSLRQWKENRDKCNAEALTGVDSRASEQMAIERVRNKFVHPLVKAGCDRDYREAYFYGLVHAGVCDYRRINELTGCLLWTIGTFLGIGEISIVEAIDRVELASVDDRMRMFVEDLATLRKGAEDWMLRLFAAEYAKIRLCKDAGIERELISDSEDIGQELGVDLKDVIEKVIPIVKNHADSSIESIDALSRLIGDDAVRYFAWIDIGDVGKSLDDFRARKCGATPECENKGNGGDDQIESTAPFVVDRQKCICRGCSQCASVCPVAAVTGRGPNTFINQYACIRCGKCVEACAYHAVRNVALGDASTFPYGMVIDNFEESRRQALPFSLSGMATYAIDPKKCKGCTMCQRVCPVLAIEGDVKTPHRINQELCRRCGVCLTKCLFGAVHKIEA